MDDGNRGEWFSLCVLRIMSRLTLAATRGTEFLDRGVQTSHALRALADAKMLASGDSAAGPIAHHEVSGQRVPGVIIAARHISGLAVPKGTRGSARDG